MSAGTLRIGGEMDVRRLGFGAMRIVDIPREDAHRLVRRAVELGADLIDTADAYGRGESETRIAEALHPYPEGLVIATKGGLVNDGSDWWPRDGSPEHLRRACEASLGRLRLERIDLYQLHRVDENVPIEESVGALAELRAEGKINQIGLSNVSVAELERAQAVAPIVSVQNAYNLGHRESEDVLERCERDGLAFLAWAPLWGRGEFAPDEALRKLLERSPVLLPIPGTSSLAHLEENMAAA